MRCSSLLLGGWCGPTVHAEFSTKSPYRSWFMKRQGWLLLASPLSIPLQTQDLVRQTSRKLTLPHSTFVAFAPSFRAAIPQNPLDLNFFHLFAIFARERLYFMVLCICQFKQACHCVRLSYHGLCRHTPAFSFSQSNEQSRSIYRVFFDFHKPRVTDH